LANSFLIANNGTRWREIFEELSQDEGCGELAENLRTSLFYAGLSVNTNFEADVSRWTVKWRRKVKSSVGDL
jgi:hypothetical protein